MADSNGGKRPSNEPEAETLKPRDGGNGIESQPKPENKVAKHSISESEKHKRLRAYRPSHKATFIGLAVVIAILVVNAGILTFLLKKSSNNALSDKGVSISPAVLSKLGVNNSQIGNTNEKLIVDPTAQFNSDLTVAGNTSIGGQLILNSTFNTSNANIAKLQAGNVTVNNINVNSNTTTSTLSTRGNFSVSGTAQFQNTVTVGQLLSVNGNTAIANNLSVGGQMTSSSVAANSLALSGSIQLGGHIITSGSAPNVGPGGALGSYGTVGVSGDDTAGTLSFNVGAGSTSGTAVRVAFSSAYSHTPIIVVTPVDFAANVYISNATPYGFYLNIGSALPYGGYSVNYIVMQ